MEEKKKIVTLDGEEVGTDNAMSLNYGRLTAAMKAIGDPGIKGSIAAMRETMRERGPDAYCVSSVETPKAKGLAAYLERIKLPPRKNKGGEDIAPPSVWIAYSDAFKKWEEFKSNFSKKDESEKRDEKNLDPVAAAQAKIAKKMRESAELAAGLAEFVSPEMKAERDRRSAKRKAREEEEEKYETLIEPVVNRRACVDNNKHPIFLKSGNGEFSTSHFDDFLTTGVRIEDARSSCVFCETEYSLTDTTEVKDHKSGEMVSKFVLRQIAVSVRTQDGRDEYVHRSGQREGQLKKFFLIVCRRCGSIATRLSPKEKGRDGEPKPSVLPRDLYPALLEHVARKGGGETLGFNLQSGSGKSSQQALRQGTWGSGLKVSQSMREGAGQSGKPKSGGSMPRSSDKGTPKSPVDKFRDRERKTADMQARQVATALGLSDDTED